MFDVRSNWYRKARLFFLIVFGMLLPFSCSPQPIYRNTADELDLVVSGSGRDGFKDRSRAKVVKPKKTAHPIDVETISREQAYQIGFSSYYGKKFHGRKTANGEIFNMYKMTAAHRVLPLGTMILVTHLTNGRQVIVKVNDRGPFIEGRILDLSFAAALELEMVESGTAEVMIEILEQKE